MGTSWKILNKECWLRLRRLLKALASNYQWYDFIKKLQFAVFQMFFWSYRWYSSFHIQALEEKAKAEKLLAELENAESPQEEEINKEGITEEEKYMLRRIGLKMDPFLLLGDFWGCCLKITITDRYLFWICNEMTETFKPV